MEEENIRILETELEEIVCCLVEKCCFEYGQQIGKAIENLLTRYKQLEEENKRLNNHNIIGRIDAIKIEDLEPVLKPYYIPKSKVEEKIEEYTNSILENLDEDRRWCDIELVDNFEQLKKNLLED